MGQFERGPTLFIEYLLKRYSAKNDLSMQNDFKSCSVSRRNFKVDAINESIVWKHEFRYYSQVVKVQRMSELYQI